MANRSKENSAFPSMKRVRQISTAHCGPATVKMLISYLGIKVLQRQIVEVMEARKKLRTHGMTVRELAIAVERLFPELQFWSKEDSSLADLAAVVNKYKYPVGVEWQGEFEEYSDDDDGHYSVVTEIDLSTNRVMLSDPYWLFAGSDRHFSVRDFEERWWDTNEIIDKVNRKRFYVEDFHLMFIVTPKNVTFPEELGMIRGAEGIGKPI
jgi:predicted double-glycine peptidase